jgi:hypothetical protein
MSIFIGDWWVKGNSHLRFVEAIWQRINGIYQVLLAIAFLKTPHNKTDPQEHAWYSQLNSMTGNIVLPSALVAILLSI